MLFLLKHIELCSMSRTVTNITPLTLSYYNTTNSNDKHAKLKTNNTATITDLKSTTSAKTCTSYIGAESHEEVHSIRGNFLFRVDFYREIPEDKEQQKEIYRSTVFRIKIYADITKQYYGELYALNIATNTWNLLADCSDIDVDLEALLSSYFVYDNIEGYSAVLATIKGQFIDYLKLLYLGTAEQPTEIEIRKDWSNIISYSYTYIYGSSQKKTYTYTYICGAPKFTTYTYGDVAVNNIPQVQIYGTPDVNISNSPSVNVSNSPSVRISGTPSVKISEQPISVKVTENK